MALISYKKIKLSNGGICLVDNDDYEALNKYTWRRHQGGYAFRGTTIGGKGGKSVHLYMHREIMNASDGLIVDHINGNPNDNRKGNLRLTDDLGNARNCGVKRKGRKFKGTFWIANKWMAQICVNRKTIYLGRYKLQKDAALAYDEAAKKYHKEFARLNYE